jgi:hypothetical protein
MMFLPGPKINCRPRGRNSIKPAPLQDVSLPANVRRTNQYGPGD